MMSRTSRLVFTLVLALVVITSSRAEGNNRRLVTDNDLQGLVDACKRADWNVDEPECADMPYWDTSQVTWVHSLFSHTTMNIDISRWDVSRVEVFASMFQGASLFNQDISKWNTSSATRMDFMLANTLVFNQDLSRWNVTSVTTLSGMLTYTVSFNSNISGWDTSRCTNMEWMFQDAHVFNQDLSGWDVSRVTNMASMFQRAFSFNGDVSTWNMSAVETISRMFEGAHRFNQDISRWDVGSVVWAYDTFLDAQSFNVDLCAWDVAMPASSHLESAFQGSPKLSLCDINECLTAHCDPSAQCVNLDLSVTCTCPEDMGTYDFGRSCLPWGARRFDQQCQENRTWAQLVSEFGDRGAERRMVTGGLGAMMIVERFEAWACLQDHPCLSDASIRGEDGDWMCYAFDEQTHAFIPWGLDSELNLVGPTADPVSIRGSAHAAPAERSARTARMLQRSAPLPEQSRLVALGVDEVARLLRSMGGSRFEEAAQAAVEEEIAGEDLEEYVREAAGGGERANNPLYMARKDGGLGLKEVQVRQVRRELVRQGLVQHG